ncbi:MAG: metallophosphoesterase [Acidobacteria bacterium]|nr:metallophosphoesterase [Acidobacteriota bacterium]
MTVNLVVEADGMGDRLPRSANVEWWLSGSEGEPLAIPGEAMEIGGVSDVRVYRFPLLGLEPGAGYDFEVLFDGRSAGPVRSFRTVPLQGPVRIAAGGDVGAEPLSLALLTEAARQSPHLLAIGGDLAYANGLVSRWPRWRTWLEFVTEALVTPEGHTVPMVLAIGNHEVNVGRDGGVPASSPPEQKAPFYFALFGQNQDGGRPPEDGGATYFRRGLGSVGALYVLDSGHLVSHEAQASWLAERMEADADLPNRLAVYHVPLYPAHRSYEGSAEGRAAWEEVFHHGGMTAAFENHDHVFKRSHPIRLGEVVGEGEGVLYLGDGCMGQGARTVDPEERWYIERSASEPHFWVAELSDEGAVFRAFDEEGQLLDLVSTGDVATPPDAGDVLPELTRIVEMPD